MHDDTSHSGPDPSSRSMADRQQAGDEPGGAQASAPATAIEQAHRRRPEPTPGDDPDTAAGGSPHSRQSRDWRLGAVIATLLTAWLLYSAQSLLNPLLVCIFLILMVTPYRQSIWARRLLVIAMLVAALWLIERLGNALAPFAIAIAVAYFLDPVVDKLEARRINRSLAIIIITVPLFGLLITLALTAVPPLVKQIGAFVGQLPSLIGTAIDYVEPHVGRFSSADLEAIAATHLPSLLDPLNLLVNKLGAGAVGVGKGIGAGAQFISFMIITPLATFYALRDIDPMRDSIRELIPDSSLDLLRDIDGMLGRWLRGQLIVCSLLGVLTWIGLSLLGVPYSLLLGLMTGAFNIIPIVGFWLSFIPVILVALTMASPLLSVLKVAVFYLIIQAAESNVVSPRIVGAEVGLNPMIMILAIVIFSSLLGFIGVVVAVPLTAILALILRRWRDVNRLTSTAPPS